MKIMLILLGVIVAHEVNAKFIAVSCVFADRFLLQENGWEHECQYNNGISRVFSHSCRSNSFKGKNTPENLFNIRVYSQQTGLILIREGWDRFTIGMYSSNFKPGDSEVKGTFNF